MSGSVKHLERAGEVEKVKLLMDRKEHINGLLVSDGRGLVCTHFAGIVVVGLVKVLEVKLLRLRCVI